MTTIKVIEIPNCTWELEGNSFYCTHDEREVIEFSQDNLGIDGHYETYHNGYSCVECGEPLDGDPDADNYDMIVEAQLMEILGK